MDYEEAHLTEKYPEFSALMREYEEGILLFEVTKIMVWDRASSDTAGLKAYHEKHRGKYMWPERAHVISYTVDSHDEKEVMKAYKRAPELTPEAWLAELEQGRKRRSRVLGLLELPEVQGDANYLMPWGRILTF